MPDSNLLNPRDANAAEEKTGSTRRSFLLLFPLGVLGGIAATLAANAFRFLRPQQQAAAAGSTNPAQWTEVAPLSELKGDAPLVRKVSVRHDAGWSSRLEEHTVFVLPQQNNTRVVSAVCPHEGCEVEWRAEERSFLCPCHDSRFNADGVPTSGPAVRNLDELPAQVENGVLKIRYQPSAPAANNVAANASEPLRRG
jgi:Rieske Fe-S protein